MSNLYHEIPEFSSEMRAGTVLSRMMDSLGFRYHWASKDLRQDDLAFQVGEGGRSLMQTLEHIYFLVRIIENGFSGGVSSLPEQSPGINYPELRDTTLNIVKNCSDRIKEMSSDQITAMPVKFDLMGSPLEFPYWHLINGPYCDAHYHVGQIVTLRRGAGNPVDPHVHVFFGKKIDPAMAEALRPS